MVEKQRHEAIISGHDYSDIKECLDEWAADIEIGDRVFGNLKRNSSTRFRVVIEEVEEDNG